MTNPRGKIDDGRRYVTPEPLRFELPGDFVQALADQIESRILARLEAEGRTPWPEWMTVRVAAAYMGTSEDAIRNLIGRGRLIAHQEAPGCRIYFRRSEIDRSLQTGVE